MGAMVRKIAENPAITALKKTNTPPPQPKLVQDYFKSEFYDPMAKGTEAIIPVKLPTGEEYKFVGGAPLVGFQEYLKSIDEMPAAIIGAKEGKPEYRYPTFFEQREGSDVQPYITSQDILSKEAYKERLDPMSFLTTLPSYVGTLQQPRTPEIPRVPRLPRNTNFFDFLSPDFSRRRSLLSESEAEERIPVGMKEGGMTNDFISQRRQQSIEDALARTGINMQGITAQSPQVQNYVAPQTVSDPMTAMTEPMTMSYVQRFGFNPYEVYGYPSFIDYNEAKMAGKYNPELEDYLGMLETASSLGVNVPNKAGLEELALLINKAQNPYLMGQGIGMKDGGIMNLKMGGVPMEMDYRQSGGFVPLGAKEKADDVPARLSKNEFVMTADAVRGMGQGDINKGAQRMYDIMNTYETIGRSLA